MNIKNEKNYKNIQYLKVVIPVCGIGDKEISK